MARRDASKDSPAEPRVRALRATPLRLEPPRIFTYVDAVARHGSIRKAAKELHVVSSALNRRILDLEEELGSTLFERLPRGVRPSAAGELFLAYVRRSLRDLEMVGSQIESLRGLGRGQVRVAVAESVTGHLLPSAIAQFQSEHPGVAFHVWIDGPKRLLDALVGDEADLILTHTLAEHAEVSMLAAKNQGFCALVAPDHPLATRASVKLSDCLAYPVALPDQSLAARALIDRVMLRSSFKFEPSLVSNSVELTKTFARWNQAVCFQYRIGRHAEPNGMVEIPLLEPGFADAQLILAARRGRVLPVPAAAFAQQLVELFETL
ncbi:MAG: transcriptional regulator [Myxococcaceae bacterium]|nr:transcriptional regulator [Myxococcaceae bacterium]